MAYEFLEIEQDPDMTDSDMIEVIREKVSEGWSLINYQWKEGIKIYTFEFS